jgi:hypothetical protein
MRAPFDAPGDWPGYAWRAVRRIIRRSGVIAMRNLSSAAGRRMRVWAFVASEGTGAVPLADGRGGAGVVLGRGAVVSGMAFPFAGWGLG